MRHAPSLAASALLLATCALAGNPARSAWADGFLAGCDPHEQALPKDCDTRVDWVEERVAQCREWTAWQLRNFNRHERTEGAAPSMRIE